MTLKSQQTQIDRYFASKAASYEQDAERGLWRYWKEKEYTAVLQAMGSIEGKKIFEAGCGKGWYAKRLIKLKPASYLAMDRLEEMGASIRFLGCDFVAGDLEALPLKGQYDRILCAGALEFTPFPAAFFKEAGRFLASDGRLILLAPSYNIASFLYQSWHRFHGFKIHLFTKQDLHQMADSSGLKITQLIHPMPFTQVLTFQRK